MSKINYHADSAIWSGEELDSLVSELRNLQRERDNLDAEIESIKDLIKEQLTEHGADTLRGSDYKITWKQVTRSNLNTKALKQAEPELCKRFERSATYKQFLLK